MTAPSGDAQIKSNEAVMMQAVWRRALKTGEIVLTMPSESDAKRLRFALYNAVRPVRQGKVVDEELAKALRDCSVTISGKIVTVQSRLKTSMMQAVLAGLGETEAEVLASAPVLMTPEEAAIAESQRKVAEALAQPEATAPRVTPYYTREG